MVSCKLKHQFVNISYNLVKIVVEGKLVKHFLLFDSIFSYSSLRSVTPSLGPIQLDLQLTTLLKIYLTEIQSVNFNISVIYRFNLCSTIISPNYINPCHTAFSWFDVSLVSPIYFEHLKERGHVKLIFAPEVTAQSLTHFRTQ